MTVIYKDVKTLTEIQSVTGQQTKALVMYDTSTGEAAGLDVEVLIKLDAEKVDKTDVEQVRSQATDKVASSKLLDDELTVLDNAIGDIEAALDAIIIIQNEILGV